MIELLNGDCIERMKQLPDNSVDAVVTDPPYGLSFMGKHWDYDVPKVDVWQEVYRVLKPGGYLLSFGGTRTYHRMACAIEDAGFEIRDMVEWLYGSGFPKSLDIGKAVDKLRGDERKVAGEYQCPDGKPRNWEGHNQSNGEIRYGHDRGMKRVLTVGTSEWEGWGTALKPAHEPICMARKPLSEKTVAENVLKHGTGGINIDGCRVDGVPPKVTGNGIRCRSWRDKEDRNDVETQIIEWSQPQGRFPANVIHDGSKDVVREFPNTTSKGHYSGKVPENGGLYKLGLKPMEDRGYTNDTDKSAARFFYCAKASKSEREYGLNGFDKKQAVGGGGGIGDYRGDVNSASGKFGSEKAPAKNCHPTVKPVALMRYLCRMVTPKGGIVLDPFMGSGTTGIAAKVEGYSFIGIEREEEYCRIAEARIAAWDEEKIAEDLQQKLF